MKVPQPLLILGARSARGISPGVHHGNTCMHYHHGLLLPARLPLLDVWRELLPHHPKNAHYASHRPMIQHRKLSSEFSPGISFGSNSGVCVRSPRPGYDLDMRSWGFGNHHNAFNPVFGFSLILLSTHCHDWYIRHSSPPALQQKFIAAISRYRGSEGAITCSLSTAIRSIEGERAVTHVSSDPFQSTSQIHDSHLLQSLI